MESMDKELIVPKWVLVVWLKITKMPQKVQTKCLPKPHNSRFFFKKGSLLGLRSTTLTSLSNNRGG